MQSMSVCTVAAVCVLVQICVCWSVCSKESPCPRQPVGLVHDKTVFFLITKRKMLLVQTREKSPAHPINSHIFALSASRSTTLVQI